MSLLAATQVALYRVSDGVERVLDTGVRDVAVRDETAYAATGDGLYESGDGGRTWDRVEAPATDLHSVAVTVAGSVVVGSRPVAVHRRAGESWTTLDGLRELADREEWPSPSFREEAWARSLATDGDRLLVGVEVGGLAVRDPGGDWRSAGPSEPDRDAVQRRDDVHDVAVRSRREWLLATGAGVYRTTDAGESWTRLETGRRRYCREVALGEEQVFAAVNDSPPRWRPPDAALYVGEPGALERRSYPGEPERFPVSWAVDGATRYAGTNDGTVLRFENGSGERVAVVPVGDDAATAYGVRSLVAV